MENETKDGTAEVGEEVEEGELEEKAKNEVEAAEDRDKEEEEEEEEEEGEETDEIKPVKKRRCQRKKKTRGVCLDEEGEFEEEEFPDEEEEEEDEDEEEEDEESDVFSYGSSILSAITFEWENEVYEFEELCDPGNIETIYRKRYDEVAEIPDELGVVRYHEICRALSIIPMVRIIKALGTEEIDLSHRNIDSKSIIAMCAALEANNKVSRFILKFNKLIIDDCWYIGRMLKNNECISYLDFTGCRVGPQGLEFLVENLSRNDILVELNLSKCEIRDEGMKILSNSLIRNNSIEKLDLSYNKLGDEAAEALATTLKLNSSITNLNLSYNNLFNPNATRSFFRALMTFNKTVTHLNMSWNGLNGQDTGNQIGGFLRRNTTIQYLDLSDNRLANLAVVEIKKGLSKSSSLEILKIGKNPMLDADTEILLSGAKGCSSLQILDLEDLWVSKKFIKMLNKILKTKEFEVKYSGIISNYEIFGPDYPKIILQRAQFEAMKPKSVKKRKDFGHLIWTLGEEPLTEEDFMLKVKKFKAKINKELFPELIKQFINTKTQLIDVVAMKKKYLSLFPDSTPPPPPKPKKGEKLPEVTTEEPKEEEDGDKNKEGEFEGEGEDEEEGELYIEGIEEEEGEMYIEGIEGEGEVYIEGGGEEGEEGEGEREKGAEEEEGGGGGGGEGEENDKI